jgi:hypothetical protein
MRASTGRAARWWPAGRERRDEQITRGEMQARKWCGNGNGMRAVSKQEGLQEAGWQAGRQSAGRQETHPAA